MVAAVACGSGSSSGTQASAGAQDPGPSGSPRPLGPPALPGASGTTVVSTHFSDFVTITETNNCNGRGKLGKPCDDGNSCTFNDVCTSTGCQGTAYSCDDSNVCTDDACDGSGGCSHTNNTNPCDDGNACTLNDVCSGGVCQGTADPTCGGGGTDGGGGGTDGGMQSSTCGPTVPGCTVTSFYEDCTTPTDDDCDGLINEADPNCQDCGAFECSAEYTCGPNARCVEHCCDGAFNADEGATDCGGSCATKCQTGQTCNINFDCASGLCSGGRCT
jgi:hypothetical protein